MEYYAAVRKNKAGLYVLTWMDLQNMLMGGEKKKASMVPFLRFKKEKKGGKKD